MCFFYLVFLVLFHPNFSCFFFFFSSSYHSTHIFDLLFLLQSKFLLLPLLSLLLILQPIPTKTHILTRQTPIEQDVRSRISTFNKKLDYASDFAEMLRTHLHERHSTHLEMAIIVLISVEIFFTLLHFVEDHGFGVGSGGSVLNAEVRLGDAEGRMGDDRK
jgi:hypothetical protein